MAWVNPRTWVTAELVTASLLNQHLRDNLLETGPAKVAAVGDTLYGSGVNALARLPIGAAGGLYVVSGGIPSWLAVGANGSLLRVAAGAPAYLALGAALQQLRVNAGATDVEWAAGGLTRAGGNLTEGSTTSTTVVDILTASGLSIAATVPIVVVASVHKTTGAGAAVSVGLKLNATQVRTPVVASTVANAAESGLFFAVLGPRLANYLRSGFSGTSSAGAGTSFSFQHLDADMSTATITGVTIVGFTDSALVTLAIDELHVLTLPTT